MSNQQSIPCVLVSPSANLSTCPSLYLSIYLPLSNQQSILCVLVSTSANLSTCPSLSIYPPLSNQQSIHCVLAFPSGAAISLMTCPVLVLSSCTAMRDPLKWLTQWEQPFHACRTWEISPPVFATLSKHCEPYFKNPSSNQALDFTRQAVSW